MTQALADFIRALPKADLHLHLDGSLRIGTLLELADAADIQLPAEDATGLLRETFPERYESLPHYLQAFRWTTAVMRTPDAVERIARELAEDCIDAGVRYIEVRFAPRLCATPDFPESEVLAAAARGLAAVERSTDSVDFHAGLIVCALRHETAEASLAAANHALAARDAGIPVVGFDLAGPEHGFPASLHRPACERATDAGLGLTIHAGEDHGPASVKDARECGATRIGHGIRILEDPAAAATLAAEGVPLEVCITSNLQTHPEWGTPKQHPFRGLLEAGLTVTLNTDNTLVSRTDLVQEALAAVRAADLQPKALTEILRGAFNHAFFPGTSSERASWLQSVDQAYASATAEGFPDFRQA